MRVAVLLIALLALTGEARADTFVPADPPPVPRVSCAAAAGDVVVADDNGTLVASTAGGPWQPIAGLSNCPLVAAAADGRAAIVATNTETGGTVVVMREPGGTFGAPLALGSIQATSVAVAPGGWAIVAGVNSEENSITAVVVRPDASTASAVLDRASGNRDYLREPRAAIDAVGNATVVWEHARSSKVRLRTARATAGGPPVVGPDLAAASPDASGLALASSPAGRTLLVWVTSEGLVVLVDGEARRVVDATTRVSQPAVAITDDGAAVIAYRSSEREIVAVDRATGGDWAIPHVLALGDPESDEYGSSLDDQQVPFTLLQAGGRAVVAWAATGDGTLKVSAAAGQAGGGWAPPQTLSSITRDAGPVGFTVSAAGAPRVVWHESSRGIFGAMLDPGPPDTTAPVVTARLPRRVAPTRTGRLALSVRVRCSEACDVRLEVASGEVDGGRVARSLAPRQAATLRLPRVREFERTLVLDPRSRRVRFALLVSDRAGNLVRRSQVVRVHVIERPLLSLRVSLDHSFGMNSAAGNRMVALLVNDLITRAAARREGQEALQRRFRRGIVAFRRAGHREIDRERVRIAIHRALELPLSRAYADIDLVTST